MKASQTVYLNADKSKAVPEGHEDARFLLVRAGHDLDDKVAEKYSGAVSLMTSKTKSSSADESRSEAAAPGKKSRKKKE